MLHPIPVDRRYPIFVTNFIAYANSCLNISLATAACLELTVALPSNDGSVYHLKTFLDFGSADNT